MDPTITPEILDLVDQAAPPILQIVGALLGMPILVWAGAWWGKRKLSRVVENLIVSVQSVRLDVKNSEIPAVLKKIDTTLALRQSKTTKAVVKAVKKECTIPSVTGQK